MYIQYVISGRQAAVAKKAEREMVLGSLQRSKGRSTEVSCTTKARLPEARRGYAEVRSHI